MARPDRNQRSADSLVRAKLAWGKKHADKPVRAPKKTSQDAAMLGDITTKAQSQITLLFGPLHLSAFALIFSN